MRSFIRLFLSRVLRIYKIPQQRHLENLSYIYENYNNPCIYLSISIYQPICLFIYLSIYLSIYLDRKRGLLQRATRPPGSKSPLEFDAYTLNHAAFVGQQETAWVSEFEGELARRGVFVTKGSAAFNHFALFESKPKTRKMSDGAMASIFGSQNLGERFSLTPDQAGFGLNDFSIAGTGLSDMCPKGPACDPAYPYRSYDASCNNLENPLWGASNTPFQRTLLPAYSDGVFRPRVAKSTAPLPSARLVSVNIVPDVDAPSEIDTLNVMQWGQFVDHDLAHTPLFRLSGNNSGVKCCMDDGSGPISQLVLHPECFPIEIPENDPFFKNHGQRCMNFVRYVQSN